MSRFWCFVFGFISAALGAVVALVVYAIFGWVEAGRSVDAPEL